MRTEVNMSLHNYKRRFERTMQRLEESDISAENKRVIYKFKDYCLSHGISVGKIDVYIFYLMKYVNMIDGKSIEKSTKDDVMRAIAILNQGSYSEETKKCFKIAIRRLYKIIRGVDEKGVYPDEVRWISINIKHSARKLPEELLTEEEMESIVRAGQCIRDKAILCCLAESGARISEIGLMKIKHISFEEYGARLTISGKTGTRKILVIKSVPYLQEWLNQHPLNDDPNAFVWYNQRDKLFLNYTRIVTILKTAARRAGIKKRVYLHLLRHSRATKLASIMSDSQLKHYLGWGQGSKMAGIYIHMSGKDTDDAILISNGINIEKKQEVPRLKPKDCLRCKTTNPATNRFCRICGFILNEAEAQEIIIKEAENQDIVRLMDRLMKNRDVMKIIAEKIKEEISIE